MRGSPIARALIMLGILIVSGVTGYLYIQNNTPPQKQARVKKPSEKPELKTVEVEIELTFSSTPISYEIKKIISESNTEVAILHDSSEMENPSYHDIQIPSHSMATYLLDVSWKEAPEESSRHFAQITISPAYGNEQVISFITHSATMMETFDYTSSQAQ